MKTKKQELIFLTPVHKQMIWGGEKLKTIFADINENRIGESWVVSSLGNNQSRVCNGTYLGLNLEELYAKHSELFGYYPSDSFPILIKYIDANSNLSIQVHPNDEYAQLHENALGKSECWLVLDCLDNTNMIIGHHFNNKDSFKEAILNKTLESGLNTFRIKKNDFFYIPSGTLHAICANSLIYEVQQNSSMTYRIYDYDRVDTKGKERELHIEKSLDVCDVPMKNIRMNALELEINCKEIICDVKYFKIVSLIVIDEINIECEGYFNIVGCLCGEGTINGYSIKSGDHIIIPNQVKKLKIRGDLHLMISEPKV